jgi:hypothetical protein
MVDNFKPTYLYSLGKFKLVKYTNILFVTVKTTDLSIAQLDNNEGSGNAQQ